IKVFAFALLLLVAVIYGETLQCHNGVQATPDSGDCVETVETCPPELDACAKVTYPSPYENTFHKSCFKMMECLNLGVTEGLRVTCCNWDNCNF
uniref:Snake toxin/toxin-like domain-containing protein n=1 Tax=Hucho hucho TaxID=62062 RepID=A0A4W5RW04_9TELE